MTQYKEEVKQREEQLARERDMNAVTGIEITINKPENIHHMTTYYNSGKQVRSYYDKRKKDEVTVEAYRQ